MATPLGKSAATVSTMSSRWPAVPRKLAEWSSKAPQSAACLRLTDQADDGHGETGKDRKNPGRSVSNPLASTAARLKLPP